MKEANPPNKHHFRQYFAAEIKHMEAALRDNIHDHEPWQVKADELIRHRWQKFAKTSRRRSLEVIHVGC